MLSFSWHNKKRNTPNKFHHAFLYLGIKNTSWKHFSHLTSGFVSIRFLIFLGSDKTIKFLNISDSGNISKSQILRVYQ